MDLDRQQLGSAIEDAVVDPDEVEPRQHLAASSDRVVARRQQGTKNLRPGQSAGDERPASAKVPPQGSNDPAAWPCRGEVILALPATAVLPYAYNGIVEDLGPDRCRLVLGSWSWPGLSATIGRFDADVEVGGVR